MDEYFGRGRTSKRKTFLNPYVGVNRRQQGKSEEIELWANKTHCNEPSNHTPELKSISKRKKIRI